MAEKAERQIDTASMDAAAAEASQELAMLDPEGVKLVADWWRKWYLKAGHKRLARVLLGKF